MADKIFENNQVSIVGEIVSDFRFSHEVYGEGFYVVDVGIPYLKASGEMKTKPTQASVKELQGIDR